MSRTPRMVLASLAVMLVLTGCSWLGSPYSILDREAEAGDELPALTGAGDLSIDPSTSRYAGEHDGVQFWIGRAADGPGTCLVVYPNDQAWVVGCAGDGLKVLGSTGTYGLLIDGAPTPDNATRLFDNIYVEER